MKSRSRKSRSLFDGNSSRRSHNKRNQLHLEPLEKREMFAATGMLDPTFGVNGMTTLAMRYYATDDRVADVAIANDQSIVAVGTTRFSSRDTDFAIARFHPDGGLDASFASQGKLSVPFDRGGDRRDEARAVAIDNFGRIIVAGTVDTGSLDRDFAVIRLTADGQLDSNFGESGKVILPFNMGGTNRDEANDVLIDSMGRIVVVGTVSRHGWNTAMGIIRLDEHGVPDPTFGLNGRQLVDFDRGGYHADTADAVTLDSHGRILIAGSVEYSGGDHDFGVVRLTNQGRVDATFGKRTIHFDYGGNRADFGQGIAVDMDDRIYVVGSAQTTTGPQMVVTRLNPSGGLDYSFGRSGKTAIPNGFMVSSGNANDVLIDHEGRIVVAGTVASFAGRHMTSFRLSNSGQLDHSFGYLGQAYTSHDFGSAVAIDRSGRIVIAGGERTQNNRIEFALARLDGGKSDSRRRRIARQHSECRLAGWYTAGELPFSRT